MQVVSEVTCPDSLGSEASDQWVLLSAGPQKSSLRGEVENGKDLSKEIILR